MLTGESKQTSSGRRLQKNPVTVSSLMFYEVNPIHLYYPRIFQCLGRIQFVHIYIYCTVYINLRTLTMKVNQLNYEKTLAGRNVLIFFN